MDAATAASGFEFRLRFAHGLAANANGIHRAGDRRHHVVQYFARLGGKRDAGTGRSVFAEKKVHRQVDALFPRGEILDAF